MKTTSMRVRSLPRRVAPFLATIALLPSALPAGVLTSTDFSSGWVPLAVQRSASVPASAQTSSYISSAGTVDTATNRAFLGTSVNQTAADAGTVSSYVWQYMSGGVGPNGGFGTPVNPAGGPPYFHIAYATSADGLTGFSQTAPKSITGYVGTYVDNTVADSSSAGSYVWRTFASVAGTSGVPGVSSVNGQTYYLHLKYSQDGGATFTANSGETPYVYPASAGAKTKAMVMNVDFSGVSSGATSWSGSVSTPIANVSNTETDLSRLNFAFDLAANRLCPVLVRITSLDANNLPTGYCEGVVLPVGVEALYRYNLVLSRLTPGPGAQAFKPTDPKVQFTFTLVGTSTDPFSWPRGAGNVYNKITVDNLCYTAPTFYAAPPPLGNDANSGLTSSSPKTLQGAMDLAQPGDVICVNPGTYTNSGTGNALTVRVSAGTPSRWITIRPTDYDNRPVLRSNGWNNIEIYANTGYIDIHGLTLKGYYDGDGGPDAVANGLSLLAAQNDAAKLNTYAGQETNPAYTIYSDHGTYEPAVRDAYGNLVTPAVAANLPANTAPATAKFNTNAVYLNGRRKDDPAQAGPGAFVNAEEYEGVHHVRLADLIVSNHAGGGLVCAKADYFAFEGNTILNNNRLSRYGGSGISSLDALAWEGSSIYRMFILANTVGDNGCNVRWTRISSNADRIKTVIMNFSDGNGIIIDSHRNRSYNGKILIQNNAVYDNGGGGIQLFKADNVDVINNTAFRNAKPNAADPSVQDYYGVGNQRHQGTTPPFATYSQATKPAYMNKQGGDSLNYPQIYTNQAANVTIRNNLLWARTGNKINGDPGAGTNVSFNYNLLGRDGGYASGDVNPPNQSNGQAPAGAAVYTNNMVSYTNNVALPTAAATGIFANSTNPAALDFLHLKTTAPASPALNAGFSYYNVTPREDRNGVRRPLGASTDIGAYEDN